MFLIGYHSRCVHAKRQMHLSSLIIHLIGLSGSNDCNRLVKLATYNCTNAFISPCLQVSITHVSSNDGVATHS
jgi:hypothetical protein